MNKYIVLCSSIILSVINLILLEAIDFKMCKSFSWNRIFTINSTVCRHISFGENILEKAFTAIIISFAYHISRDILTFYNTSFRSNIQLKNSIQLENS